MNFFEKYKNRFKVFPQQIETNPAKDLNLIVVIPCFNEPNILPTLYSLFENKGCKNSVEVIIVVNSAENTSEEIKKINLKTINNIIEFKTQNNKKKISFQIIKQLNLIHKTCGVGLARKIGMDEAIRRFAKINNPNGIIANIDADTVCQQNYFQEIEKQFTLHKNNNACSIYYEHPIEGTEFDKNTYEAIILYELYLRYYIEALRFIKFPYAYHTIGSAFAVRASIYAKQGGMNTRQAGEDFYFLHKIIPLGGFFELNSTIVYPSPRSSDRVPFGTGIIVKNIIEKEKIEYLTYDLQSFLLLKPLFGQKNLLYQTNNISEIQIDNLLLEFLSQNNFEKALININKNCSNLTSFNKKFFEWFNAFRILKFLNFVHEKKFKKISIIIEAVKLLSKIDNKLKHNDLCKRELLQIYRNKQKNK